jgi:hypothetical protein
MLKHGDEGFDEDLREARHEAAERRHASRCRCGTIPGFGCPGPERCPFSGADDHDDEDEVDEGFGEFDD